ncbi:MAG: DnaJ domain-containing protein [Bdellovibrionales bacterium]|nr:DnaJ domain-containing protein [Bdellovibrionales bacterium]
MKDYYRILNVSPASTKQAIRKSYRKLAGQFHPDKNQSAEAEEKFKQISEAYNVLSNEERRKEYDQSRKVVHMDSFSKAHKTDYKKKAQPAPKSPPKKEFLDASIIMELNLEEACMGCERQIVFNRINNSSKEKKQLTVKIPKGIESGKKLKLVGQSHQKGGKKGDLFIEIRIKKHPLFRCDQKNLIMQMPISISDAVLGKQMSIPTLTGRAKISIRPGTQSNSLLILKNQGLFYEDGVKRGDLILEICIDIPAQITEEDRKWFKEFKIRETLPSSVAQFNIQMQKLLLKRAS